MTLHLTYVRDVLDLVIGGVLAFAGFRADARIADEIVLTVGVVLLLLALIGFVNPDTATKARSIAGIHFTEVMNIFDAHHRSARRAVRPGWLRQHPGDRLSTEAKS